MSTRALLLLVGALIVCRCALAQLAQTSTAAARPLPQTSGVPVAFGDTLLEVQAALKPSARPMPYPYTYNAKGEPQYRGDTSLRDRASGLWLFFGVDTRLRTIRLEAPFAGTVAGLRIGDDSARLRTALGDPLPAPPLPPTLPESVRRSIADSEARRHRYAPDPSYGVIFETDTAGLITAMLLSPRALPSVPRAQQTTASAAAAATAAPAAGCDDPFIAEPARFEVTDLEIGDRKSGLVWFRCPAMWVGANGKCDPSMVLPSETWAGAMEVSRDAVRRRSAWRLASVDELDTIAAKGCGYLINPKFIEIMFDTLWTRSEANTQDVFRYGVDRTRVVSPRRASGGQPLYAQSIYVRNAP